MKIDQNKMVSLIYELREAGKEGRVLEVLKEDRPLSFIFGTGRLLPAFEANLSSLGSGDTFSFNLNAEEAYGDRREEMVIDVPISVFMQDGKIDENICRVGNEVPLVDGSGNPLLGIINEVTEDFVKMDFNHPMAGIELFFSGKIIEVREPTQKELSEANNSCSSCSGHGQTDCGGSCS
jgi:FKBP-type peptidyl-prolyl cis-trans isomerase SlyD